MHHMTALMAIAIFSIPSVAFTGTGTNGTGPKALTDFNSAVCNLGLFSSSDSIHTVSVVLRNTGDTALVIDGVETTCSCTSAALSNSVIAAGDSATVVLTYNAAGKWPGQIRQAALIRSNAANSTTGISITGFMYDASTVPDSTTMADWPVTDIPLVTKYARE